jgi:tetratricopeptide (TPR) repeat protein
MKSRCPVRLFRLLACACAPFLLVPANHLAAEALPQNTTAHTGIDTLPAEERGDVLLARQQYIAAIEAYREAPQDAEVYNKIGIAYHHMLAFDIAKKDYERALLIRPNYPEAINNLGAADFAQGRYRQATNLYRKALKLMPTSAVVAANLGTAYFARHKFARGMQAYRQAFRLDPSVFQNDVTQIISGPTSSAERAQQDYCLAELFAQSGMRSRAIEYLRKAFDEGFADRNRVLTDHVFDQLRSTTEFAQLMGEQKVQ